MLIRNVFKDIKHIFGTEKETNQSSKACYFVNSQKKKTLIWAQSI